jgi:hypothetical protein
MTSQTHQPHELGPTIVTASLLSGPHLRGAGPAVAVAMAAASLIGVGVAQAPGSEQTGAQDEIDPDEIAASAAPTAVRAAPPLDRALIEAMGVEIRALSPDEALAAPQGALGIAEAPFAELQRDDVLVAGCALEPVDGVACVRVLRGAEFVEVRLRT